MSLKNFLDLRKKDVQIVEKVIIQKRPWYEEVFRTLLVILIASVVVWGISQADTFNSSDSQNPKNQVKTKSFSAIGLVSDITTSTLSIDNAKGSDNNGTTYTFDTSNVKKIETKDYSPLALNDIQVGDKIIVQGIFNEGNNIEIRRIISFGGGTTTPQVEIATSTATTTLDVASTTQTNLSDLNGQAATTSDATTTDASTTPSIIDNIINTATTTFQNIVDAVVGTSTHANLPEEDLNGQASTSTSDVSSSTQATSDTQNLNGQAPQTPAPDLTPTSEVTPPASDSLPASDTPSLPADTPVN